MLLKFSVVLDGNARKLRPAALLHGHYKTIYYRRFVFLVSDRSPGLIIDQIGDGLSRIGDEDRTTQFQCAAQIAIRLVTIRQMSKTITAGRLVKHHQAEDLFRRRLFRCENLPLDRWLRGSRLAQR